MLIKDGRSGEFDARVPCGYCGSPSRRVFGLPKGQKSTHQKPGMWKCQRGHLSRRKMK